MDGSVLDFTVQRSRIAVKNPRVRPPKDPRSLLHMPSLEPMPSSHLPVKIPAAVPLGGLGIGIKLPGRSLSTHGMPRGFNVHILHNLYIISNIFVF